MARSDELMRGFQVGYQNAPFSALGSAIKSTLGRLTQQEDMTSGLVTKAGIGQMFQDPNERLLTQAKLATELQGIDKTNLEMAGLRDYYGIGNDGVVSNSGTSPFGTRPARTSEEAMALVNNNPDYTTEVVYTKNPLGLDTTTYRPVLKEEAKARLTKAGTMEGERQSKISAFKDELTNFLTLDDVIHEQRKSGAQRFGVGVDLLGQSIDRSTPAGKAMANLRGAINRLRLQLVRIAGDVGNIRLEEQEAQEKLIPNEWDDYDTAELKRQYLTSFFELAEKGDSEGLKNLLYSLGFKPTEKTLSSKTSPFNPKSPLYRGGTSGEIAPGYSSDEWEVVNE